MSFCVIDTLVYFIKFLLSGVDGHLYKSVKEVYTNTESCVQLSKMCTDFFNTTSGVLQRDVLSPTLFFLIMILLKT